ncbi:RrF2 family transcriptional regulator [Sinisalibacter lacisalsi]|uniref:Rrf2 family transcriptional regulator n=1 Tax=Sinisalibacter lacisalsi TaxID=1526570 RepID=A0ABQ1QTG1_9RHOB|nr:Rrf2 family transcriptional regulator [Sinisalibacter lacisalsi]GGD42788.1 Rrf2 family transcriptional regulator [Sinisalibacter lacisalsi]
MRLTTRTNLAIRALMYCAVHEGETVRSAEIARACNSSANHLAQVINALHAQGFVNATRGRLGGVRLARRPRSINIGAVFRLFEADVPFTECFAPETNTCPLITACRLRSAIRRALEAFYHEMDLVTLEDLVKGNCMLEEIFRVADRLGEGSACSGPGAAASA